MGTVVSQPVAKKFQKVVLDHFKKSGRDLPWRQTQNPYHIVVSEIMLQQTQVDRVVPYFNRFIGAFPDWHALAQASFSEIYKYWQGLGYNRRARQLKSMAIAVVENHNGILPSSYEELTALPGIGPYTAGAIRAFAFNKRSICIETNIRTVYTHHFFPRARAVTDVQILKLVEATLPPHNPRRWYAALMDYGSYLKRMGVRLNAKNSVYTKQKPFEGSLRQLRGRILKELVKKSPLSLAQVRRGTGADASLIRALQSEGLIELEGGSVRLAR